MSESYDTEELLRRLIDSVPSMLGYWDANLINRHANEAYTGYFGLTPGEIRGMHIKEVLGEDLYNKNLFYLRETLAGHTQIFEREVSFPGAKKSKMVLVKYVPDVFDGRVAGFFSIVTDLGLMTCDFLGQNSFDLDGDAKIEISKVTRILANWEIERAKAVRNAKLASLGELSAGIAHEINNPLAIISGSLELMDDEISNPKLLMERMEVIRRATFRIARIVQSLKKFSRTSERLDFKVRLIRSVLEESLVLVETRVRSHGVSVFIDCQTESSIVCDEVEIEQVIINLLSNALDAIKNLDDKWIRIMVFDEGSNVVFRVTDSGQGISEEFRSKIFDPFFTTKKSGEGTGLGLSITKGILEEHRATISILEDSPNTCFEIRFQRASGVV